MDIKLTLTDKYEEMVEDVTAVEATFRDRLETKLETQAMEMIRETHSELERQKQSAAQKQVAPIDESDSQ